jgi:S-DNA-T family DNA segregation ATPase FtsK/SpoIIIE
MIGEDVKCYSTEYFGCVSYIIPAFLSLISIFIYVGWHRKESSISVVLKIFGIIFLFFGLDSLSNQGKIGQVIRDMDLFIGSPGSIIISLGLIIGGITLSSRLCWMKLINYLIMKIKKNELERVGLDNDITYKNINRLPTIENRLIKDNKIETVLENFDLKARVIEEIDGPVVTSHLLSVPPGVKTTNFFSITDDVARDLKVESVMFQNQSEKGCLSLQIPNSERRTVNLKDIFLSKTFSKTNFLLPLALGSKAGGEPLVLGLEDIPHLLVAGTTGSGKSCLINSILIGLIKKCSMLDLILIDPKQVEFNPYQGISQLKSKIITDINQASSAISWLVTEMEKRYALFGKIGVRSIHEYNDAGQNLNRIVMVIDEYADLILNNPSIDNEITRLCQKSRAAGIHIIVSTQRPSSDVITPHIKANIPCRIALKVSSKSNSRVIIDQNGAESLLGKGDALILLPNGKVERFHSAFISDSEMNTFLVKYKEEKEEGLILFDGQQDENKNSYQLYFSKGYGFNKRPSRST